MVLSPLFGQTIGTLDGGFVIAEWEQEPGPEEGIFPVAPLHLHHDCDEAWYVLKGALCVQVGDAVETATEGGCVFVSKGTPHTYWNPSPEPVRYLLIMTTRTAKLIEAIHAASDRSRPALEALFESYGATLL